MSGAPSPPSAGEALKVLDAVLDGTMSRDDASRWAMRWVAADNPGVDDLRLWTSLTLLGGIDLTHGEGDSFL